MILTVQWCEDLMKGSRLKLSFLAVAEARGSADHRTLYTYPKRISRKVETASKGTCSMRPPNNKSINNNLQLSHQSFQAATPCAHNACNARARTRSAMILA